MGAVAGVAQEGADALGHGRREAVLEVAGLLFHHVGLHLEGLREQHLRQAVTANEDLGPAASLLREVRLERIRFQMQTEFAAIKSRDDARGRAARFMEDLDE